MAEKKVMGENEKEHGNGQTPRKVSGKEDGSRKEKVKEYPAKARGSKNPYTTVMVSNGKAEPGGEPMEMEVFPEGSSVV